MSDGQVSLYCWNPTCRVYCLGLEGRHVSRRLRYPWFSKRTKLVEVRFVNFLCTLIGSGGYVPNLVKSHHGSDRRMSHHHIWSCSDPKFWEEQALMTAKDLGFLAVRIRLSPWRREFFGRLEECDSCHKQFVKSQRAQAKSILSAHSKSGRVVLSRHVSCDPNRKHFQYHQIWWAIL